MAVTQLKPRPTHREIHPIRECRKCGCYLRSYNESTQCTPCGTPPWEIVEDEMLERIAAMPDSRKRRKAFEALAEMQELEELMAA